VSADESLPPPKLHVVESPSKGYVATVDPKSGVAVRAADSRKVLWESPKTWSRSAFLADDGEHFVTGYDGLNLIPVNYTTNLVLITFWKKEQKIRDVTVGDLFPNTKVLVRTVSHYRWGGIQGITNNTLIVRRCDKKEVKFDVGTGKVTK
jgi:hypothetical protein